MVTIVEKRLKAYYQSIGYQDVTISEDGETFPQGEVISKGDVSCITILVRDRKFYVALILTNGQIHPVDEKKYESIDDAEAAMEDWWRYLNGEESERLGRIEYYYNK